MAAYLRFAPAEFDAILHACRPIQLGGEFFPFFKYFLVECLTGPLRERIEGFRSQEMALLFDALRGRRAQEAELDEPGTVAWGSAELKVMRRACRSYQPRNRLLPPLHEFLAEHFRDTRPGLARVLRLLSPLQAERLYQWMTSPEK